MRRRQVIVGRAILTQNTRGRGNGGAPGDLWNYSEPSLPLIAKVHKQMQPKGVPCDCRWCVRYRRFW